MSLQIFIRLYFFHNHSPNYISRSCKALDCQDYNAQEYRHLAIKTIWYMKACPSFCEYYVSEYSLMILVRCFQLMVVCACMWERGRERGRENVCARKKGGGETSKREREREKCVCEREGGGRGNEEREKERTARKRLSLCVCVTVVVYNNMTWLCL